VQSAGCHPLLIQEWTCFTNAKNWRTIMLGHTSHFIIYTPTPHYQRIIIINTFLNLLTTYYCYVRVVTKAPPLRSNTNFQNFNSSSRRPHWNRRTAKCEKISIRRTTRTWCNPPKKFAAVAEDHHHDGDVFVGNGEILNPAAATTSSILTKGLYYLQCKLESFFTEQ